MHVIDLLIGIILIYLAIKFGIRIIKIISNVFDSWLDKLEDKLC
jgi:hypothetical protein